MSVRGDIILNYYDSLVTEFDIQLLDGPNWLNDTLISFYIDYLEHETYNNINVCFLKPEVTQCIKLSPDNISVFLDPVEFRHKPYAIMIINDCSNPNSPGGTHWSLLIYSSLDGKFYHLDSSEGTNRDSAKEITVKICKYLGRKCDLQSLESLQQSNGYDCGIFVLCNLDNVLNQIVKKRKLSTLQPVNKNIILNKRGKLKELIIGLHRRETKPKQHMQQEMREDLKQYDDGLEKCNKLKTDHSN